MKAYTEECDNGLAEGCDLDCFKNPGYQCTEDEFGTSTCETKCGDGIISGSQMCETKKLDSNGNLIPVTGCTSDCNAFDSHYSCQYTTPITYSNQYTDYLVRMGTSQPRVNDDHLGKLTSYYTSKTVACTSICGDGFRTPQESCDNNNAGCTNCNKDEGYTCPVDSASCEPILGDGYKTASEQCDSNNLPGCTNGKIDKGYTCS